jgi:hypothetical protein
LSILLFYISEWHYGVLLLYGQCLAMNHLIVSNYIKVSKLDTIIDYPSANEESVFKKVLNYFFLSFQILKFYQHL